MHVPRTWLGNRVLSESEFERLSFVYAVQGDVTQMQGNGAQTRAGAQGQGMR